jgi:hypothetical protein
VTRLLSLLIAFGACSSHNTPTHPTPARDAGVAVTESTTPTEAECDKLFDHAIDLQATAETKLTDDERAKLHGELRDRSLARCRAMPHASYACALAAPTLEAFTSCDSAQP